MTIGDQDHAIINEFLEPGIYFLKGKYLSELTHLIITSSSPKISSRDRRKELKGSKWKMSQDQGYQSVEVTLMDINKDSTCGPVVYELL